MIVSGFIYLGSFIAGLILQVFPNSSGIPQEGLNAIAIFSGYVGMFNPIIPIPTMLTIIGLVIAFEILIFGFETIRFILSYIPFINGK